MKDLIALVNDYATARAAAAYHKGLLECLTDDNGGFYAATISQHEADATTAHAQLMTAYDQLTRTTVRAVPDERLPVCTWQKGRVEVRGIVPDASRGVRVRYTPEQAIAAGSALIACAALAEEQTGGTLTPILAAFPPTALDRDSTAAGEPHRVDTGDLGPCDRAGVVAEGQHALHAPRLLAALTLIGDLDPVIADVLKNLHLRVYPRQPSKGDRSDYIVLDLHGVSIGARRCARDFYLHADTTETNDRIIAFEVNGCGEHDHPTR